VAAAGKLENSNPNRWRFSPNAEVINGAGGGQPAVQSE